MVDKRPRLAPTLSDGDLSNEESGEVLDDVPVKVSRWSADREEDSKGVRFDGDEHEDEQDNEDDEGPKASRWVMDFEEGSEHRDAEEGAQTQNGTAGNDAQASTDAAEAGASSTAPVSASGEEPFPDEDLRDMLQECRKKEDFELMKDVGKGTYGIVCKARDKTNNKTVALKKIILPPSYPDEGFPMTSVREINILLTLRHENIVNVTEVAVNRNKKDEVYMVMDFVQQDLKVFLSQYKAKLRIGEIKRFVQQMLRGIQYLHEHWVLHRDLKPANILYDHFGNIKICDFGMARHFGRPVPHMTPVVVTRNYRGPEVCMGVTDYERPLDIWSVGIIAAELITNQVPFIESNSDINLVNSIAKVIGSPHEAWKGFKKLPNYGKINVIENAPSRLREKLGVQPASAIPLNLDHALTENGYHLIKSMLRWDPEDRISAEEALKHPWFDELPRVVEGCFMPQTNNALRRKHA